MSCRFPHAGVAASVLAAALAASASTATAATFTWTGLALPNDPTSWANPFNWSPILAPTGLVSADRLVFGQEEAQAGNDIRDDFRLSFLGKTSGTGTVAIGGRSLRFAETDAEVFVSGGTLAVGNELRGAATLLKSGSGQLTLSGDSAEFGGRFVLVGGTLNAQSARAMGGSGRISILQGARLVVGAAAEFAELSGSGQVSLLSTATVALESDVAFLGNIDGAGGFRKQGSATFTMFGRGTASGRTDIQAGTFLLSGRGARWGGTGVDIGAGGTVRIAGGAQWDAGAGNVSTSGLGTSQIRIENGATLASGRAALGTRTGNAAEISVVGFGAGSEQASWDVAGDFTLGGDGTALLIVGNGGRVSATGRAVIGAGSTLKLEGGHFEAGALSFAQGSQMAWASGVLRVTGVDGLRVGSNTPAQALLLTPGRTLEVSGRLVIEQGATIRLAGGSLPAGHLALAGGTLTTARDHAFALGSHPRLSGFGTVEGRYGHLPDHTLAAEGGVLTLVDTVPTPFKFDGNIEVATSGTLAIEDEGVTDLLGSVDLADGGRLRSVNGLRWVGAHEFRGGAGARIDGLFFNDHQVQGSRDAERPLEFTGHVAGSGAFVGYVQFSGLYDPGESPASVFLQNMRHGAFATLRLEIGGYRSGADHDFVRVLETASLDGTLAIDFLDGFAPSAGDAFTLMSYGHRTGAFAHLTVTGLSPDLNASLGYGDHDLVLRIAAVPEPAEWALMAVGLGFVLTAGRRKGVR